MVTIAYAYTAPINPANATPVLNRDTVFSGLRRKVRLAQEFVPVIASCDVVSEDGNVVTREVVFKDGAGPPGRVKEVCVERYPTKVDFQQTDGTTISNIISDGPGGPDDLMLTYSFEWKHPDIEEGSPKIDALMERHSKTAKMAVDKTIEHVRNLVQSGKLKVE